MKKPLRVEKDDDRKRRKRSVILLISSFLLLSVCSPLVESQLRSLQFTIQEGQFSMMESKLYDALGHIQVDLSNLIFAIGPRDDTVTQYGLNLLRKRAKDSFYNASALLYFSLFNEFPPDSLLAAWQKLDHIALAEKRMIPIAPVKTIEKYDFYKMKSIGELPIYREAAYSKQEWLTYIKYCIIVMALLLQACGMWLLNVPFIQRGESASNKGQEIQASDTK